MPERQATTTCVCVLWIDTCTLMIRQDQQLNAITLAVLAGHQKWVWDCVFSVDAAYLVTASSDCSARLWDLSTGDAIRMYSGHHKAAVCCALNDSAIEGRDAE